MSSRPAAATSSLMPQHSTDLAAELSSHLTNALASDKSYTQINDAKMRGISSLVGWDQFHGMVLTAHLAPVNLRADPIDEISKGIARTKKVEQQKARQIANFAVDQLSAAAELSQADAEQQKRNEEFLKEFDLRPPTNAHEFARDWKRLGASKADGPDVVRAQRYRYLLSIELRSTFMLLKGGIPLDMIASILDATHFAWTHPVAAVATGGVAPAADAASADAASPSSSSEASTLPSAAPSSPSPPDVHHIASLLHALTAMSSFTISVFGLTKADKQHAAHIFDLIDAAIRTDEYAHWQEASLTSPPPAATTSAEAASAAPAVATAPAPAAATAKAAAPVSSSYPMLLSGWPAGVGESSVGAAGTAGLNSHLSQPARDESTTGSSMVVSAAVPTAAPSKSSTITSLTPEIVQEMRGKYKV